MTNEEALKAITAFVENYACESDLDGLREAIKALKEQRPHGEWVFEKGDGKTRCDGWGCSSCGRVFHTKVPYFAEFLFCPNCGASMKKEGDSN